MIKSKRLRWAGNVARMEEGCCSLKILTSKPRGERPGRRREDNIRIDLKEKRGFGLIWAQDRDY